MRYTVSRDAEFSAAHSLRGYEGPCCNVHGHNWKVRLTVGCDQVDERGMVIDFSRLSTVLKGILDTLDHTNINEHPPFDTLNPTSENLARYIFEQVTVALQGQVVTVASVEVWETDRSRARYGV